MIAIAIGIVRSGSEAFNEMVYFESHVVFTKPFMLTGGRNLKIEGFSEVDNTWIYVVGDVINEKGAIVDTFDLPIEYYHGYDGGAWAEGSRIRDTYLAALPAGNYSMRLEGDWDSTKNVQPRVLLKVDQGAFRWMHFWLALLLLTIPPLFFGVRSFTFEGWRWSDSMYMQTGALR